MSSPSEPFRPAVRLFFVRHGETVDNVAQVYAGVTNSALTNHGVQQADRLGEFLAVNGERFDHIFASDLDRASLTAEAIRKYQLRYAPSIDRVPDVIRLALLQEQNFGSYELLPFGLSPTGAPVIPKVEPIEEQETYDSVARRADEFLTSHLVPVLVEASSRQLTSIAVVSHGITLSVLWRRFLKRLPPRSVTVSPEALTDRSLVALEHLGSWSNTGFLQLDMSFRNEKSQSTTNFVEQNALKVTNSMSESVPSDSLLHWSTTVVVVNGKLHLQGHRRTKGGIGSSKFDDKQKSINDFFRTKS